MNHSEREGLVVIGSVLALIACEVTRTYQLPGQVPHTVAMSRKDAAEIDALKESEPSSGRCEYWKGVVTRIAAKQRQVQEYARHAQSLNCAQEEAEAAALARLRPESSRWRQDLVFLAQLYTNTNRASEISSICTTVLPWTQSKEDRLEVLRTCLHFRSNGQLDDAATQEWASTEDILLLEQDDAIRAYSTRIAAWSGERRGCTVSEEGMLGDMSGTCVASDQCGFGKHDGCCLISSSFTDRGTKVVFGARSIGTTTAYFIYGQGVCEPVELYLLNPCEGAHANACGLHQLREEWLYPRRSAQNYARNRGVVKGLCRAGDETMCALLAAGCAAGDRGSCSKPATPTSEGLVEGSAAGSPPDPGAAGKFDTEYLSVRCRAGERARCVHLRTVCLMGDPGACKEWAAVKSAGIDLVEGSAAESSPEPRSDGNSSDADAGALIEANP